MGLFLIRILVTVFNLIGLIVPSVSNAEFSASLVGTSNYFSRGYSKSDGKPAVQGNIDYEHSSGLYLGTWVSSVDFGDKISDDPANIEVSPYLGWTFQLFDDWRLDAQLNSYIYDGEIFGESADYYELYIILHFRDLVTLRAAYSEDAYSQSKAAADYELTGRFPITDSFELSGGLGYSQTRDITEYDYLYWNAGVTWYYKYLALDFRYVDAVQASEQEDESKTFFQFESLELDSSFVFTVTLGF